MRVFLLGGVDRQAAPVRVRGARAPGMIDAASKMAAGIHARIPALSSDCHAHRCCGYGQTIDLTVPLPACPGFGP